jgi:hypothetical protein
VVATTDACRRWCDRSWTRVVLPFSYTRDAPKRSPVKAHYAEREHPGLNPGLHHAASSLIDIRPLPANLNAKKPPDQRSRGSTLNRRTTWRTFGQRLNGAGRLHAMCDSEDGRDGEPRTRSCPWQSAKQRQLTASPPKTEG